MNNGLSNSSSCLKIDCDTLGNNESFMPRIRQTQSVVRCDTRHSNTEWGLDWVTLKVYANLEI